MYENVLKKGKIGNVELRNRFVMSPMGSGHSEADGSVGEKLLGYYTARARGGFGLIITEFTAVNTTGFVAFNQLRIHSDELIPGFRRLTDAVHAEGAKIFMQIHHAGRTSDSRVTKQRIVSSSPALWHVRNEMARELTNEEVYEYIEQYSDAALRVKKAGFDGVELHGAHGYLIPQFMSAHVNRRIDEFGGDIAGRATFATEIIRSIKQKCGADFPVSVRFSGDEIAVGGMKLNESRVMAKMFEKAGADVLHISVGIPSMYGDPGNSLASLRTPMGFNTYAAEEIKKSVKIPVITVGRIVDPAMADAVIEDGMADFITLGRASIADPEFPKKVLEGRTDEISPCVGCMGSCLTAPPFDVEGIALGATCSFNPFSARETEITIEPANIKKTIVVVGGGVGGLEAAWVSAARGHKVILLEKNGKPGGQALTAGMLPNYQGFARAIKYYITMCNKHGVDIRLNTEATADIIVALNPDVVILCTGATPSGLEIQNDGIEVVQAADLLNGNIVTGKNVLVIEKTGFIGLDVAYFLLTQMRSVTVAEMMDDVGDDVILKDVFLQTLSDNGVSILTGMKAERFTKDGAVFSTPKGEVTLCGYDTVVLAVGVKPYNPLEKELEGKVPEVHVIGDAKDARRIVNAVLEAAELAVKI